jgi:prepilin-type N-terminal cleavage/methylation domain-containing protein
VFKQPGFTMIELLVVLVILGLTSALVLPKFPAIYERFKGKAEEDKFYQSLSVLSLRAYTQQAQLVLDKNSVRNLLDLPESWQITIDNPIIYKASGVCLGGKVGLSVNGVAREILLRPPYCDPSHAALMNITQGSARD